MTETVAKRVPGSSPLTEEQRAWFETHIGERYLIVEDGTHGVGASRKQRRAAVREAKRRKTRPRSAC